MLNTSVNVIFQSWLENFGCRRLKQVWHFVMIYYYQGYCAGFILKVSVNFYQISTLTTPSVSWTGRSAIIYTLSSPLHDAKQECHITSITFMATTAPSHTKHGRRCLLAVSFDSRGKRFKHCEMGELTYQSVCSMLWKYWVQLYIQ